MTGFSFDANAALQRARKSPAHPTRPTFPTLRPAEGGKVGKVGSVGPVRASEPETSPRRILPTHPPFCAFCGVADWHVALSLADGRKAHVACAPSSHGWTNPNERNLT